MEKLEQYEGRVFSAQQVQWRFATYHENPLPWDIEIEIEPMEKLLRNETEPSIADCWIFYKFEARGPHYIATKTHWPSSIYYSDASWDDIIKKVRLHFRRVREVQSH
jgi:hypothetical protein